MCFGAWVAPGKGVMAQACGHEKALPDAGRACYHDLGGEIITVGSDAHEVKFFAYRFDVVADMLKNAGFNYYTIFNERKPEFIRL